MDDIDADYRLNAAQLKKKFREHPSYTLGHEGYNRFMRKCQLRKGKQGQVMKNAEYYWSYDEGMTYKPAAHRYPVYRTNIPRPTKESRFNGMHAI